MFEGARVPPHQAATGRARAILSALLSMNDSYEQSALQKS
jgi:hypothetical protein